MRAFIAGFDWSTIAASLELTKIAAHRVPESTTVIVRAWLRDSYADRVIDDDTLEDTQHPMDIVTDVLRGLADELHGRRKREHPAYGMNHLGMAMASYVRLAEDADKRGDPAGADAWRIVIDAIEHAENVARKSRERQTWRVT